jgi:16S rRNA G1207 methylase RsmC
MSNNFINKNISFKFRGMDFTFDLSQGLFSSAGVDNGTKFLLKILSQTLDEDTVAGKSPPLRVLDAGCGTGVIGICAAAAIAPLVSDGGLLVRSQDRDELARLITTHNAALNGIAPTLLEAHTEPLLAGPPLWDLILTNIPAKAGTPVLADFVRRSAGLLNPGGRVIMVAVRTLVGFFRERIAAEAELLQEHTGPGHSVLVYTRATDLKQSTAVNGGPDFITRHPFYVRTEVTRDIEDIPIHLTTIHGAGGFDNPGGAVLAAAKLARRLQFPLNDAPLLVHEPEQGFFPCWLLKKKITTEDTEEHGVVVVKSLRETPSCPKDSGTPWLILSGRNILALEASRYNVLQNVRQNVIQSGDTTTAVVPVADLQLGETALLEAAGGRPYGCIAAFPELLPQSSLPKGTDQLGAIWDAAPPLLAGGGIFLVTFSSSDAERFDRKKPAGFTRLGSVKRNGFRALAYRYTPQ